MPTVASPCRVDSPALQASQSVPCVYTMELRHVPAQGSRQLAHVARSPTRYLLLSISTPTIVYVKTKLCILTDGGLGAPSAAAGSCRWRGYPEPEAAGMLGTPADPMQCAAAQKLRSRSMASPLTHSDLHT